MNKDNNRPALRVVFLGGVGEIGKNMTALEFGDDIIVIDCGSAFPSGDMPGIDLVIPDITYLNENRDRVRGIVLTHGHEDHIGALPYILRDLKVPVYGTRLTLALVENKLKEHKVEAELITVKPKSIVRFGKNFKVEFISVCHSIAGSCALAISTPLGIVFHTGDFKIDHTPIDGANTDLQRIAELGRQGVLLLLGESTNVERPGYTMSEATVGRSLNNIFNENYDRRIFVATFASNIHRVQQILDIAYMHKRKVAFSGRSMINVAECAARIGELHYPKDLIIDIDQINKFEDKQLVIITTGSQGEPMSALTRMASDEFNKVKLDYNDTIIMSSSPIPGNERHIYNVINNIYRHGARVIYESLAEVHVSGHACQEELKLMHRLLSPAYFIPVHGEHRHQKKHAELAMKLGMSPANILITDIGNVVEITSKSLKMKDNITAGQLLVDGLGIGDVGSVVLQDRKHLSEEGLCIIVMVIDKASGEVVSVDITSRGFVYLKESEDLLDETKKLVLETLSQHDLKAQSDYGGIKNLVRKEVKAFLFKKIRRNPMILTMAIEV